VECDSVLEAGGVERVRPAYLGVGVPLGGGEGDGVRGQAECEAIDGSAVLDVGLATLDAGDNATLYQRVVGQVIRILSEL